MEEVYYRQLVKRYLEKQLSDDELEVFAHLLLEGKLDDYLGETMIADEHSVDLSSAPDQPVVGVIKKKRLWPRYVAAASVLLGLCSVLYFYHSMPKNSFANVKKEKHDFVPGTNKATLTLGNGSNLTLSGVNKGLLARQGKTDVNQKEDGKIAYSSGNKEQTDGMLAPVLYNTVTTPKGGQYQIDLPDGTRVWLNSASSIHFPTTFTGKDRPVEISGEVYFEVAKDKDKPFIVTAGNQQVTVLGTHFNVNAYKDDGRIKTTLLEGSVKIKSGSHSVTIKPGEQAQVDGESQLQVNNDVDTDEIVAWKNGYFQFNNTDVRTIMNQISRWYDVDVSYEGPTQPGHYNGKISRNVNASKVLKVLELSGMHLKIEGGKIIVK